MLIILLISCMKPVQIDAHTAHTPQVQLIMPVVSQTDVLDLSQETRAEGDVAERERRYLSYPKTTPNPSVGLDVVELEPTIAVKAPTQKTISVGDSLWWSFNVDIEAQSLDLIVSDWEWIWHSPRLLELRPEALQAGPLTLAEFTIQSLSGQALTIPEQSWTIVPISIEKTHYFASDNRLELCLTHPAALHYAQSVLSIRKKGSESPHKITVLPHEGQFSEYCEGQNSLGILWESDSETLFNAETERTVYQSPLEEVAFDLICTETPCRTDSPFLLTGAHKDDIKLFTNRKWSDLEIQQSPDGWLIYAQKPNGKHRIRIHSGSQSLSQTIDIVEQRPQLNVLQRIQRPQDGSIILEGQGQWTYTLYPVQPEDWPVFLDTPAQLPTQNPILVRTQKAVDGQLHIELPQSTHNHLLLLKAGDQHHSIWLLPETLFVDHLKHPQKEMLLISTKEGPLSEAALHHETGSQLSNASGQLSISARKIGPESYITWQDTWHPIIQNPQPMRPPQSDPWSVFLTRQILKPKSVLKVHGWGPKANAEIHWSIASNDKMDILTGKLMSGLHSDIDLQIPIPQHCPPGEYQLHLTQQSVTTTLYFSVENHSSPPQIALIRSQNEIDVVVQDDTQDGLYVMLEMHTENHTDQYEEKIAPFWLPPSTHIQLRNVDPQYSHIRVRLSDINHAFIHEKLIPIPAYPSDISIIPSSPVLTQSEKIELRLQSLRPLDPQQNWSVATQDSLLCTAPLHSPCSFQSVKDGHNTFYALLNGQRVAESSIFILSAQAPKAEVIQAQNQLFIQARSPNATIHVYSQAREAWQLEQYTTTTGYVIHDIPPQSTAVWVLIWDQEGRTALPFTPEDPISLQYDIQEDQLKVRGEWPSSGLILIDATNPKSPKSLGPVKSTLAEGLSWQLPRDSSPRQIKLQSRSGQEVHIPLTTRLDSESSFRAPQVLRLGEEAFAELRLTNIFDSPQRFHYQLTFSEALENTASHRGSVTVEPHSSTTIQLPLKAQMYGTFQLSLDVQGKFSDRQHHHDITILPAFDDSKNESEFYVDVFDQGRYSEHLLEGNHIISITTEIQPTLSLLQAVYPFFEAPPNLQSKYQLSWVGHALWDELAHARHPDRTQILDQMTEYILQPVDSENAADNLLWDIALLNGIHNGVTPSMMMMLERFERIPYSFDPQLPTDVLATLHSLQHWAVALAQTSLYKGVAPEWPPWPDDIQWQSYPVIAQSILLRSAQIAQNNDLQKAILDHWTVNSAALNQSLPEALRDFFGWSASANIDSVRWALAHGARWHRLNTIVGQRSTLPKGDLWALLAAEAQQSKREANLKPELIEDQHLIMDGRYHPYRTEPIFYRQLMPEPKHWQLLIFGRGRQYYTLGSYAEGRRSADASEALLSLKVKTDTELRLVTDEMRLNQHSINHLQLQIMGAQAHRSYWLYWPDISGLKRSEITITGGSILSQEGPWIHIKADLSALFLSCSISPQFSGSFRIPPFRWYSETHRQATAQTQSYRFQVRSEDEYRPEPLPVE